MDVDFDELDKMVVGVMQRIEAVSEEDISKLDKDKLWGVLNALNGVRARLHRTRPVAEATGAN